MELQATLGCDGFSNILVFFIILTVLENASYKFWVSVFLMTRLQFWIFGRRATEVKYTFHFPDEVQDFSLMLGVDPSTCWVCLVVNYSPDLKENHYRLVCLVRRGKEDTRSKRREST